MDGNAQASVSVVINRITASLICRLGLPFQYIGADKQTTSDWLALQEVQKKLAGVPRYTPGQISVAGWKLTYVDVPALISCFDVVVAKRWNDFSARRADPVILDCGANIGVSVLHYKRLYPRARITAFEPDKKICAVLRENLAANRVADVTVVEAAVWTATGSQTFISEGADSSRLVSAVLTPDDKVSEKYTVNTIRLADYLTQQGAVDFIKLDVEGAEAEVLADCADRLRNVQSMVIEFHLMSHNPQKLGLAFTALSNAGFNLSVNSYGDWIDLLHPPGKKALGDLSFDQYLLVCAWRSERKA